MLWYIFFALSSTIVTILLLIYLMADKVDKLDLHGKNIIITGGTDGLGLDLSKQLTQRGANVVPIGRSAEKMKVALEEIAKVSKVCQS